MIQFLTKTICPCCGHHFPSAQRLTGINPFNTQEQISGCPQCKRISRFRILCQIHDCWAESNGTVHVPWLGRPAFTCRVHNQKWVDANAETT